MKRLSTWVLGTGIVLATLLTSHVALPVRRYDQLPGGASDGDHIPDMERGGR